MELSYQRQKHLWNETLL